MMYVHGVVFHWYKGRKGEPIYPRFEVPEMVDIAAVEEKTTESVDTSNIPPLKENISYDDFEKIGSSCR